MQSKNSSLEHGRIGRKCESCGDTYTAVVMSGPGKARRGCGCPAVVAPTEEELAETEQQSELSEQKQARADGGDE